jgi:V8-like Glu-specific endopeptidase
MRSALALWVMCTSALACAPPAGPSASRRSELLGGTAAPGESQVFLLDLRYDSGQSAICSAVLISPRALLTAAHCIEPVLHASTSVTVRAMNKPDITNLMTSETIIVTTYTRHPSWNAADTASDFDLAALLLMTAPVGVTPAPLASALVSPVGKQVKAMGYGRLNETDFSSSGTRRSVMMAITAANVATLDVGDGASTGFCLGDSGGPSFLGTEVVGIHSRANGATCGSGVDIRVDNARSFIDAFLNTNDPPQCAADGRCAASCPTVDPDCAPVDAGAVSKCLTDGRCEVSCGLIDADCLDDGALCTDAALCLGGLCSVDARGFDFCSRACADDSSCLNGTTCQTGVCRPPREPLDGAHGGCTSAPGLAALGAAFWLRRRRFSRATTPA